MNDQLVSAISAMADRYADAVADYAIAGNRPYNPTATDADRAAATKSFRRVMRRREALDRLVLAFAEVSG